ncbi:MAG: SIMPL domain-containing protein [Silicimonas sp.]|nr:SIMPL domain-containing protein [Silicimonas sp.]
MRATLIALSLGLAGLAGPALADDGDRRELRVTGEGSIAVEPDMARLTLGVSRQARSAAEAMEETATAVAEVLDVLDGAQVAAKDIQTTSVNLSPIWDHSQNNEPPRVVGYQASNMLSVKLRDLAAMGGILDAVVGDEILPDRINEIRGISFSLADPDPVEDQARVKAVEDARAKAALLAEAAGLNLGPVVLLVDGASVAPQPGFPVGHERLMAADMPVAAGEVEIRATVTLVYEIAP